MCEMEFEFGLGETTTEISAGCLRAAAAERVCPRYDQGK